MSYASCSVFITILCNNLKLFRHLVPFGNSSDSVWQFSRTPNHSEPFWFHINDLHRQTFWKRKMLEFRLFCSPHWIETLCTLPPGCLHLPDLNVTHHPLLCLLYCFIPQMVFSSIFLMLKEDWGKGNVKRIFILILTRAIVMTIIWSSNLHFMRHVMC